MTNSHEAKRQSRKLLLRQSSIVKSNQFAAALYKKWEGNYLSQDVQLQLDSIKLFHLLYLNIVYHVLVKARAFFQQNKLKTALTVLAELQKLVTMAMDLTNMMRIHRIRGFVFLIQREFTLALKEFHDLRDIATEADRDI